MDRISRPTLCFLQMMWFFWFHQTLTSWSHWDDLQPSRIDGWAAAPIGEHYLRVRFRNKRAEEQESGLQIGTALAGMGMTYNVWYLAASHWGKSQQRETSSYHIYNGKGRGIMLQEPSKSRLQDFVSWCHLLSVLWDCFIWVHQTAPCFMMQCYAYQSTAAAHLDVLYRIILHQCIILDIM